MNLLGMSVEQNTPELRKSLPCTAIKNANRLVPNEGGRNNLRSAQLIWKFSLKRSYLRFICTAYFPHCQAAIQKQTSSSINPPFPFKG